MTVYPQNKSETLQQNHTKKNSLAYRQYIATLWLFLILLKYFEELYEGKIENEIITRILTSCFANYFPKAKSNDL